MFIYAQIDDNGICIGVSQLHSEMDGVHLIPLPDFDTSVVGKQYVDGEFIEVLSTASEAPQVTNAETSEQNMAIIEGLIDLSERLGKLEETLC